MRRPIAPILLFLPLLGTGCGGGGGGGGGGPTTSVTPPPPPGVPPSPPVSSGSGLDVSLPDKIPSGIEQQLTVTASAGSSFTGRVKFHSSDPAAILPSPYTFTL